MKTTLAGDGALHIRTSVLTESTMGPEVRRLRKLRPYLISQLKKPQDKVADSPDDASTAPTGQYKDRRFVNERARRFDISH
jgi:hypothetical protein